MEKTKLNIMPVTVLALTVGTGCTADDGTAGSTGVDGYTNVFIRAKGFYEAE